MRRFILVADRSVSALLLLNGTEESGEPEMMLLLRFSSCPSAFFPCVRARRGKLAVFAE